MKTKYKFFILVIAACLSSIAIYYIVEKVQPVSKTESLIDIQYQSELSFSDGTYTIDNPKIILNPYGISPLTALVIFDTKDLTTPTVTIKGNDNLTTYTNIFKPAKKHYLPIYGLYADTNNEIIITL